MIPDWQLPPGTDRGLWDYVQNPTLAQQYDASLAGTALLETDIRIALQEFPAVGRLIDLGCGTGRLLLPFAQRGFDCTGVDLSSAMLQVAQAKAEKLGLSIHFQQANLVELDSIPNHSFDYAACLFSTLGMIRGMAHRHQFLQHVHRILKPSGKFLLHVHNRGYRVWSRSGRWWWLQDLWNRILGRELGDRRMPQHQAGAELTIHHFSFAEIQKDLTRASFQIRQVHTVSTKKEDALASAWFLPCWRAYGYLLSCQPIKNRDQ